MASGWTCGSSVLAERCSSIYPSSSPVGWMIQLITHMLEILVVIDSADEVEGKQGLVSLYAHCSLLAVVHWKYSSDPMDLAARRRAAKKDRDKIAVCSKYLWSVISTEVGCAAASVRDRWPNHCGGLAEELECVS